MTVVKVYHGVALEVIDDKIVVIQFEEISHQAVDAFVQLMLEPKPDYQLILIDSRIGLQPIQYVIDRMQHTFRNSSVILPQNQDISVAFVIADSMFTKFLTTFVRTLTLKNVRTKFFNKNEYDKAIAWLESQQN